MIFKRLIVPEAFAFPFSWTRPILLVIVNHVSRKAPLALTSGTSIPNLLQGHVHQWLDEIPMENSITRGNILQYLGPCSGLLRLIAGWIRSFARWSRQELLPPRRAALTRGWFVFWWRCCILICCGLRCWQVLCQGDGMRDVDQKDRLGFVLEKNGCLFQRL